LKKTKDKINEKKDKIGKLKKKKKRKVSKKKRKARWITVVVIHSALCVAEQ
jgi:phosphate/sulfate permease